MAIEIRVDRQVISTTTSTPTNTDVSIPSGTFKIESKIRSIDFTTQAYVLTTRESSADVNTILNTDIGGSHPYVDNQRRNVFNISTEDEVRLNITATLVTGVTEFILLFYVEV